MTSTRITKEQRVNAISVMRDGNLTKAEQLDKILAILQPAPVVETKRQWIAVVKRGFLRVGSGSRNEAEESVEELQDMWGKCLDMFMPIRLTPTKTSGSIRG